MPRKRDIEAAVAAYNAADRETLLPPPDATRLLTVMFAWDDVCRRSLGSFQAEGFNASRVRRLLRALVDAGFLSKEPAPRGLLPTYRLHLPPVQR